MALQSTTRWRPRLLQVCIGTPVLLLALVASLALSGGIARAASSTDISTDPFTQATCAASNTTNHHTEVEPDTFSFGSTIVAAYQVGRIFDGGACAIGFATSTNNGSTWTTGLLPGITKWTVSQGTGPYARATDAAVAYDAKHNTWMVSSLALTETGGVKGVAVVTSRSTDGGFTWGNPVVTASVTGNQSFDKNWIVCDTTPTSPHYGNCYTEWDDNGNGNLLKMSTSTDGGLTWSAAATNGSGVIGGQPVVRPDGTVIVPIDNANESALGAFNSTNGGASWSAITTITTINHHTVAGSLREGPLPSVEVDGAGTVYVAWSDCRFRSRCRQNDIVITHSTNATGTTWATITRVPIDATTSPTPWRSAAPNTAGSMSASRPSVSADAEAVTSARPRRICDRITPELPRAPCRPPSARAAVTSTRSPAVEWPCRSALASAERMVNSMLVPVSASATGKTLSRLISSVCTMRSSTASCAQSRRPAESNRRPDIPPPLSAASLTTVCDIPRHR